jgi:hypothetical protein
MEAKPGKENRLEVAIAGIIAVAYLLGRKK